MRSGSELQRRRALAALEKQGAESVLSLVEICEGSDTTFAHQARRTLDRVLQDPEAVERLCRLLLERDHSVVHEAALTAGYAPIALGPRALFYYLTEQWKDYEDLDPDHSLLQDAYAAADEGLQVRLLERARHAGSSDIVDAVAGGQQGLRVETMTDAEWETVSDVLAEGKRWADAWHLAQCAPARWSVRLLQRLARAEWIPDAEAEQEAFRALLRVAERCTGPERCSPQTQVIIRSG